MEPELVVEALDAQTNAQETQVLKKSIRFRQVPDRYGFLLERDVLPIDEEPTPYHEAIFDIDSDKWFEVMRSEMDAMHVNQVWTLVEPPEMVKPIRCKWVFKRKIDKDGKVQTYKARLVAKGYNQ